MDTKLIRAIDEESDRIKVDPGWANVIEPLCNVLQMGITHADREVFERLYSPETVEASEDMHAEVHVTAAVLPPLFPDQASYLNTLEMLYSKDHTRPTVIEGESGSGKTTWLKKFLGTAKAQNGNRVRRKSLDAEVLLNDNRFAFIDCSGVPADFIKPRITGMALHERILYETFKAVKDAYVAWSPSALDAPWGSFEMYDAHDLEEMISGCMKELHGLRPKKRVWVIIDNADYRSREEQQEIIKIARYLIAYCKVEPIVSIRPETIRRDRQLRNEFARETVQSFRVPHYSVQAIISKRAKLAADALSDFYERGISISLVDYAGVVHHYASKEDYEQLYNWIGKNLIENDFALEFMTNIHNGDIGKLFVDFSACLRGADFAKEIVTNREREDKRRFLTSYLRGGYYHHRPEKSLGYAVDLFDTCPNRPLLGIRVLELLLAQADGSMVWEELDAYLHHFGYSPEDRDEAMGKLLRQHMVLDLDYMWDWENQSRKLEHPERLRITDKGKYHLANLLGQHRYMGMMADCHPFPEEVVREDLGRGTEIADIDRNTAVLVNEIYRYVYEDLLMIEQRGGIARVREFLNRVRAIDGLFMGCVEKLGSSLSKVVGNSRPHEVEQWWNNLKNRAVLLGEWRAQVLQGADIGVVDGLPRPDRVSKPVPCPSRG